MSILHMGGYQNDGPFWGPLNNRCRIRLRNQKETRSLITTCMDLPSLILPVADMAKAQLVGVVLLVDLDHPLLVSLVSAGCC